VTWLTLLCMYGRVLTWVVSGDTLVKLSFNQEALVQSRLDCSFAPLRQVAPQQFGFRLSKYHAIRKGLLLCTDCCVYRML